MLPQWLVGVTGTSMFDVWTIVHTCFWVFIGSCLWSLGVDRAAATVACVAVAYAWEAFERLAEELWPHLWLTPESWLNSYVSDPITCVVGLLFIWHALDSWR